MQHVANQLKKIIFEYTESLKKISDEDAATYPLPGKWSKKEELGHLVDSAHNNLRRFIVAQIEMHPKIVYAQNDWVQLNNYNAQPMIHLVDLWLLLNKQIVQVLSNMPAEAWVRECDTGKEEKSLRTLQWLATDYIKHLLHHLHHILGLESIAY